MAFRPGKAVIIILKPLCLGYGKRYENNRWYNKLTVKFHDTSTGSKSSVTFPNSLVWLFIMETISFKNLVLSLYIWSWYSLKIVNKSSTLSIIFK